MTTDSDVDLPDAPANLHDLERGVWYRWQQESTHAPALISRLDPDRYIAVVPFLFTYGVVWGWIRGQGYSYEDRWCYHGLGTAIAAATVWALTEGQGEPDGWHRHPTSGRRRPDGDPAREHISK